MPPRWPDPFPADTRTAMLVATFAKKSGRAVAFSLAAFRQAFAAGKDLSQTDNVLIAAAACELHPRAVLKGIETRSTRDDLQRATDAARELGHHRTARPGQGRRRTPGRAPGRPSGDRLMK